MFDGLNDLINKLGNWKFMLILWYVASTLSGSFYAHCLEPDATIGTTHYSGFVSSLQDSCAQQGKAVSSGINKFFIWLAGISTAITLALCLALSGRAR